MEFKTLQGHKQAQAWAYRNDRGEWGLMSYNTKIIIVKGSRVLATGTYSRTTIKHIGWFLREYLPDLSYQDIKTLIMKNQAWNFDKGPEPLTDEEKRIIKQERKTVSYIG